MYEQSPYTQNILPQSNVTVSLTRGFVAEVPGTHPVHYRPLMVNYNESLKNRVQDVTRGGLDVNHAALRGIARELLAPSRQSRGAIAIANGWDQPRLAVFLEFEIKTPTATLYEVLTGYTDYVGVREGMGPNSRLWDPNMFFFVNSHMRTQRIETVGQHGRVIVPRVMGANQILRPITVIQGQSVMQTGTCTAAMRPCDALYGIQRRHLTATHGEMVDPRSDLNPEHNAYGVASNRQNSLSSRYLETAFRAYGQAVNENDNTYNNRPDWTFGVAANYASETSLDISPLLNHLNEFTGYATTGCITFGELFSLWPYAETDNTYIQVVRRPPSAPTTFADHTNGWGNVADETIAAHALSHAVPATMSTTVMIATDFTATNMTPTGRIEVGLSNAQAMFPSQADAGLAESFRLAMETAVLPEIFPTDRPFSITVKSNFFAGTTSHVGYDGYQEEPYNLPNYSDSLAASTIAADVQTVDSCAMNMEGLLAAAYNGQRPLVY